MTSFKNTASSLTVFQVAHDKSLLFSMLQNMSDTQTNKEHEKSKESEIKCLIQTRAIEVSNCLPAYFTNGKYENDIGGPLS